MPFFVTSDGYTEGGVIPNFTMFTMKGWAPNVSPDVIPKEEDIPDMWARLLSDPLNPTDP